MTAAVFAALAGWALAGALAALALTARRRLTLVARAEHELRGPVTVLSLAARRLRRDGAAGHAEALDCELARLAQGLDDLAAARHGGRAQPGRAADPASLGSLARSSVAGWAPVLRLAGRRTRLRWDAGAARARLPGGRAAQLLGNLMANAAEHGRGDVELRGRRVPAGVRVEVRSGGRFDGRPAPGRGTGLALVRETAEEAGGRLDVVGDGDATVVAVELPLARRGRVERGEAPPPPSEAA